MVNVLFGRLLLIAILIFITTCSVSARERNPENRVCLDGTYSELLVTQRIKPRYLRKAEREAARRERQMKKAHKEAVKENLKRSIEIQTPEVQERMRLNRKEANAAARARRKANRARAREAAKKYR